MAEFNYAKSQQTADKLITKFGGKLKGKILREVRSGGTDTRPEFTPEEIPCTCVAVDYTIRERQALNVQEGAKRIMISPLGLPTGFELQITDVVQTRDGGKYTLVPPEGKFMPTDKVLFYDVQGVR